MTVRMLRLPEVCEITGLSETTIWRRERDGEFPPRRKLGSTLVAWRSDEIDEWVDSLPPVAVETDEPSS